MRDDRRSGILRSSLTLVALAALLVLLGPLWIAGPAPAAASSPRAAAGAATPMGAEATQLYALFNAQGHAGKDFSGIIEFLRGSAG